MQTTEKQKEYNRRFYQRHKEKVKQHCNMRARELKLAAMRAYSSNEHPQCARCGIDDLDVLCIDHIDGGGNKGKRHGYNFYCWLKRKNYPDGYQLLCANCNMKKFIVEGC